MLININLLLLLLKCPRHQINHLFINKDILWGFLRLCSGFLRILATRCLRERTGNGAVIEPFEGMFSCQVDTRSYGTVDRLRPTL